MKKKSAFFLIALLISSITLLFSQTITVEGKVTDINGNALPGVNIQVKGTSTGTSTDFDGNYQIVASQGDMLIFSFLGYKTKEIQITGTPLNVALEEDAQALDEVVITAFGIEKETKSLGYSVQQVNSDELQVAGQTNALTSLQGQVSGLSINRASGSAGGGVDILIRGVTSVNPGRNNQPLIIIDGVALNNDTFAGNVLPSNGSNSPGSAEQFSFSNRAIDINPDDVESYSVLKGAAATALYGIRASNGAIIITTKKGKLGKAKVNISSAYTFREVKTTPELQSKWREGRGGVSRITLTPDSDTGFELINGATFSFWTLGPAYADDDDPTIFFRDFYDEFFKTATNLQTNINVSGATERINYYLSASNSQDKGIVPNTDYDRTTFRIRADYKVTDNFNIDGSVAYTTSGGKRSNSGDKSIMSALSFWSPSLPVNDYINPDGTQRNFVSGIVDNPRYFAEVSNLLDDVDRWVGNLQFNWAPKEWLNISYRAQVDNYADRRNRFVASDLDVGTQVGGFIVNENIRFTGLESNLLVTLSKDLSEDLTSSLTLGHQIIDTERTYDRVRGEGLNVPNINSLGNTTNLFAFSEVVKERNMGVYADLRFEYLDKLFLSITGRNDWVSTLPKKNRSFFYPSVSLSYLFNDLIDPDGDILSFAKFRTSWAQVGKTPNPGDNGRFFSPDGSFPFNGVGGFLQDTSAGDADIEPEKNNTFEIGADLRFLKNRIRLDYTYYNTKVKNLIFGIGTAPSTSLSRLTTNAGDLEGFGHELLLSADIIKNENFSWSSILNWSTSETEVVSLPEEIPAVIFANAGFAGVLSQVKEGDKLGTLYGWTWRYENGQRYIGDDGLPRVDLTERKVVGNAFPDWIGSINNSFNYKNFNFQFLLEYKKGGQAYDSGQRNGIRNGILQITELRDEEVVLEGVMDDGSGGFITNTTPGLIDENYYRSSTRYNRASEILVQDTDWVKLRNISLSYEFPRSLLEKIKIENASLTVSANNILIWTPFKGFDPEGNQFSAGSNTYGFTGLNIPLTENYTVGLKLGF